MEKFIISTLIIFLTISSLFSQENENKFYPALISIVPQYILNNGIRVDLDRPLKANHNWLSMSMQLYLKNNYDNSNNYNYMNDYYYDYDNDFDYNKAIGIGFEANYRIYNKNNTDPLGPYISFGLLFQHTYMEAEYYDWETDPNTGLYLDYNVSDVKENVEKFGANMLIGMQFEVEENFYLDFYTGLGIKHSLISTTASEITHIDRFYWDYDYSGVHPIFGVRLGFMLK